MLRDADPRSWLLGACCCLFALLAACTQQTPVHTAPSSAVSPDVRHEGEIVVAVVERLEHKIHAESLPNGEMFVSNVVAFGIVAPERFSTMLFVQVQGHQRIGDRPFLLGDAVSFVLPRNWRNRELALSDLEGIAFTQ